jgi:hypothetical protein
MDSIDSVLPVASTPQPQGNIVPAPEKEILGSGPHFVPAKLGIELRPLMVAPSLREQGKQFVDLLTDRGAP